jgi:hypothetical protein
MLEHLLNYAVTVVKKYIAKMSSFTKNTGTKLRWIKNGNQKILRHILYRKEVVGGNRDVKGRNDTGARRGIYPRPENRLKSLYKVSLSLTTRIRGGSFW